MTDHDAFDPEAVIDAMAPLVGLDVMPGYRPGIATNLKVTAAWAELLLEFPLGDHADPGAVFQP